MAQSVFCQGEVKHVPLFKERLIRGTLTRRCLGDMAVTLILSLDSLMMVFFIILVTVTAM